MIGYVWLDASCIAPLSFRSIWRLKVEQLNLKVKIATLKN